MRDSRDYKLYPNNLNLYNSYQNLFEYINESKYLEANICDNIKYELSVDESRSLSGKSINEFLKNIQRFPNATKVNTHFHWKNSKTESFGLGVDVTKNSIIVWVESDDFNTISALHDKAREYFMLKTLIADKSPELNKYSLKKTVFLAHRFDEYGRSITSILSTFLRRLGFEVLEGEGYESRDIPEKVAERIKAQDIFICLVTAGDSSWLISEAAFAKALKKYVIILLENDVVFNKGIIGGDFEHISFQNGNIEKSFNEILFALP